MSDTLLRDVIIPGARGFDDGHAGRGRAGRGRVRGQGLTGPRVPSRGLRPGPNCRAWASEGGLPSGEAGWWAPAETADYRRGLELRLTIRVDSAGVPTVVKGVEPTADCKAETRAATSGWNRSFQRDCW